MGKKGHTGHIKNVPLGPVTSLFQCFTLYSAHSLYPHSQPAGSAARHKETSFKASPPTGITCFHPVSLLCARPPSTTLLSPLPILQCFKYHMTPLGLSSPSSALKLNKRSPHSRPLGQSAGCRHSMHVLMHLDKTPCFSTWSCRWEWSGRCMLSGLTLPCSSALGPGQRAGPRGHLVHGVPSHARIVSVQNQLVVRVDESQVLHAEAPQLVWQNALSLGTTAKPEQMY